MCLVRIYLEDLSYFFSMYVGRYVCMYIHTYVMKNRPDFEDSPHGSAFLENFQDAPHGSAIFFKIFRMLPTGARFSSGF